MPKTLYQGNLIKNLPNYLMGFDEKPYYFFNIKDNHLLPSVSASKLYNSGSTLYWSGDNHIPNYPIAPKVRKYYHHNFWDPITTSTVYIPWFDQSENSSNYGGSAANLFICNAKLLKVFARFCHVHYVDEKLLDIWQE